MSFVKVDDCLFCKIVAGEIPCHKVWEDDTHLAFLTIFPNTDGFTVVVTKDHHESDALAQEDSVLTGLVLAAKQVARKINAAFDDVGRTGLMMEGFGVNHLHCKLFPMHGTKPMSEWKPLASGDAAHKKFFTQYEGFMSSHDGERGDDAVLAKIAAKIREA
jgi:diadenosine tetraphosphate (Ap4A) HIT family hydrolase